MNFLDILIHPDSDRGRLNEILGLIETRILTRVGAERSTSSCKFWQLKLNLICAIDNLKFNDAIANYIVGDDLLLDKVAQECHLIGNLFSNITNDVRTLDDLYKVVYNNNPFPDKLKPVHSIDDLIEEPLEDYSYGDCQMYSLCIHVTDINDGRFLHGNGLIQHFFTLIKKGDLYFINSSYGSDYVCIPQNTIPITPEAFAEFCNVANDISDEGARLSFNNFIQDYFLSGGVHQRLVMDDKDDLTSETKKKYHRWLPIEEGKQKEIDLYSKITNNFTISLIRGYKNDIQSIIASVEPQPQAENGFHSRAAPRKGTIRKYSTRPNNPYRRGGRRINHTKKYKIKRNKNKRKSRKRKSKRTRRHKK